MEKPIIKVYMHWKERGEMRDSGMRTCGKVVALKAKDWIFSGERANVANKRAFFLLDFEVVSRSNHRQHKILA